MQKGARGAHASSIRGDVHVDVTGAGAHRSVHVIQNRHAHFAGWGDEGWRCGMRIFGPADVYGPAGSAPGIGAALPVLLTLEDRKHVGEGPALGSVLSPPVVIPLHAPHPHHGIYGGTATKYVAESHIEFAIAQSRRGGNGQVIIERTADVIKPDAWIHDRRCIVRAPGFYDEYLRAGRGQFRR